jgi:hypothetical protein
MDAIGRLGKWVLEYGDTLRGLMRMMQIATLGAVLVLAACGSSGRTSAGSCGADTTPPAIPTAGMVVWMANGQTFTASNGVRNDAYHVDTITIDSRAFQMGIMGFTDVNETCLLVGQFSQIPPPVGTYPLVDAAVTTTLSNDSFVGTLTFSGPTLRATSHCGQVVLTKSEIGDIEGTFVMEAVPYPLNPPKMTIVGAFNVGCLAGMPCGPYSTAGTCVDLLACCDRAASGPAKDLCMTSYTAAMMNGDTACGNTLAVQKQDLCP